MNPERRAKIRELLDGGPKSTLEIRESLRDDGIYEELRDMEGEGLVRSHTEPGGPERGFRYRRIYRHWFGLQLPTEEPHT